MIHTTPQMQNKTKSQQIDEWMKQIRSELNKAYTKWPHDVDDPLHMQAIRAEELLEVSTEWLQFQHFALNAIRSGHDVTYADLPLSTMRFEVIQSLCMCVRALVRFERFKPVKRFEPKKGMGIK